MNGTLDLINLQKDLIKANLHDVLAQCWKSDLLYNKKNFQYKVSYQTTLVWVYFYKTSMYTKYFSHKFISYLKLQKSIQPMEHHASHYWISESVIQGLECEGNSERLGPNADRSIK